MSESRKASRGEKPVGVKPAPPASPAPPACRLVPVDEIAARVKDILGQDASAWGKSLRRMLLDYSK